MIYVFLHYREFDQEYLGVEITYSSQGTGKQRYYFDGIVHGGREKKKKKIHSELIIDYFDKKYKSLSKI